MAGSPRGNGYVAAVFGLVAAGLVVACGGIASGPAEPSPAEQSGADAAVQPTDAGVPAQPVSVVAIVGDIPACPSGFAHPNVCCLSGPAQGTACAEGAAPFAPCDRSSFTFPDPTKCCSLDSAGGCVEPSGSSAPSVDAGTGCQSLCGPGSYAPAADAGEGFAWCADVGPDVPCVFCCGSSGCPSNQCGCPATLDPDAAAGCSCDFGCSACPAGWSTPQGLVDLCCRTNAAGAAQCFSQSSAVPSPPTGIDCGGSADGCQCTQSAADGHAYAVTCDSTKTPECTCTVDGVTTGTLSVFDCPAPPTPPSPESGPITVPVDPGQALFAACGFPSP